MVTGSTVKTSEKELIDPSVDEGGLYTAESEVKRWKGKIIIAAGNKSQALHFLGRSIGQVPFSQALLHQNSFIYYKILIRI
jgi:hypothetical protein